MDHWFQRAHRLGGDRAVHTAAPTSERLWALVLEVVSRAVNGTDALYTLELVEAECRAAAAEGDAATIAQAGLVLAVSLAAVGEVDRALVELRASLRRARSPLSAGLTTFVEVLVAQALATTGRVDDARTVLRLADPALIDAVPMLVHSRALAECHLLAAEDRVTEATEKALEACRAGALTPALLARSTFCLWALTHRPPPLAAKLREIADTTGLSIARGLADLAERHCTAEADALTPIELMRSGRTAEPGSTAATTCTRWARPVHAAGKIWRSDHPANGAQAPAGLSIGAWSESELTRREQEIALLVAEGLSNREIATRLYLSVRTVESHIYQGRAKVDAGSRGELGRIVASGHHATAGAGF